MFRRRFLWLAAPLLLSGCQETNTAISPPEPQVHNAVTDYVERGLTAKNKAEEVKDKLNARPQAGADLSQHIDETR